MHGVYRWLSIIHIWVHYFQSCVFPKTLCADWSGPSIPLVENMSDARIINIVLFLGFMAGLVESAIQRFSDSGNRRLADSPKSIRRSWRDDCPIPSRP